MNAHAQEAAKQGQSGVNSLAQAKTGTRVLDFMGLMKLRLNVLVLAAVATGYALAAPASFDLLALIGVVFGVLLAGGGSSAMNMALEADRDRRMDRTKHRPVASGVISADEALLFGVLLSVTGVVLVALISSLLAAALTASTVLLYVFAYTPLKTRTPLNTWVGAIPGAIPPMIGWAAATGSLSPAAWSLFGIVFFWQFPHFFAIASIYKEDYRRGGFKMLPVVDESGRQTGHQAILAALVMIPVALLPAVLDIAGTTYFIGAFGITAGYLVFAVRAAILAATPAWRDLLRVSLLCLPGLFVLMMIDRLPF